MERLRKHEPPLFRVLRPLWALSRPDHAGILPRLQDGPGRILRPPGGLPAMLPARAPVPLARRPDPWRSRTEETRKRRTPSISRSKALLSRFLSGPCRDTTWTVKRLLQPPRGLHGPFSPVSARRGPCDRPRTTDRERAAYRTVPRSGANRHPAPGPKGPGAGCFLLQATS